MTYVEFFENSPLEDICACLSDPPDKVIMVGEGFNKMEKKAKIYAELMKRRGYDTVFVPRTVGKLLLKNIVDTLCEIVESHGQDELAFGITGGEGLYLVAMGIVFERYSERNIQIHRFNLNGGTVIDCDDDGRTIKKVTPSLSVEENINIYGGKIIYEGAKESEGTVRWDMNGEFADDINRMWEICRENPTGWNKKVYCFSEAESLKKENADPLVTEVDMEYHMRVNNTRNSFTVNKSFMERLCAAGILKKYSWDGKIFRVEYKNEQVKRCLMKAGQVLEMKVYSSAMLLKDDNGGRFYNDVMNGVCIDWDGKLEESNRGGDTSNEIDVIMMHGTVPIFVSCKNGQVNKEELYKLNSVAERFGGKYVKKVLVATALDAKSDFGKSIIRRANDMNIYVETKFATISDRQMRARLKNFITLRS